MPPSDRGPDKFQETLSDASGMQGILLAASAPPQTPLKGSLQLSPDPTAAGEEAGCPSPRTIDVKKRFLRFFILVTFLRY